jgi:hypothetical protein
MAGELTKADAERIVLEYFKMYGPKPMRLATIYGRVKGLDSTTVRKIIWNLTDYGFLKMLVDSKFEYVNGLEDMSKEKKKMCDMSLEKCHRCSYKYITYSIQDGYVIHCEITREKLSVKECPYKNQPEIPETVDFVKPSKPWPRK